jgi:hypothetical protein
MIFIFVRSIRQHKGSAAGWQAKTGGEGLVCVYCFGGTMK